MEKDQQQQYTGRELEVMSFATNYHQWIVDEFEPFLGKNVVEVGAGVGDLTEMLLGKDPHHLYAYEPAANLFPTLKQKMENRPRVSVFNESFCPKRVAGEIDSMVYINVLEHIEDDSKEVASAYEAIRPGGYLLLFVPALQWLFSEVDRSVGHYRRYYKKNIVDIVEKEGFIVDKVRYFDLAGILPWYVNFVLLNNELNDSSVALYDKVAVPPMRFLEGIVHPPIGKNILLAARKR